MMDLARRISQANGMTLNVIDVDATLPVVSPQSPFFNEVKRACHNLKVLVETEGVHTNRLTRIVRRLQACIAAGATAEVVPFPHSLRPDAEPSGHDVSVAAKMRATSTGSNRYACSSSENRSFGIIG